MSQDLKTTIKSDSISMCSCVQASLDNHLSEAIMVQFITAEEGNTDNNWISALWLQLYLSTILKHVSLLLCILTEQLEH